MRGIMDGRWWFFVCVLSSAWMVACGARAFKERNNKSYRLVCVTGLDPDYSNRDHFEEDIDYSKCTHVIYHNEIYYDLLSDSRSDYNQSYLTNPLKLVAKLRKSHPNITHLFSWNGWVEAGRSRYFDAKNPEKRAEIFKNLTSILTEYDLDGVDLTWRYSWDCDNYYSRTYMFPKDSFTEYVQALREELDKYGLLLTATVTGRTDLADRGYDIPKLSKYLDFIILMGYDLLRFMHRAQHHAPISSIPQEDNRSSVKSSLKYWLDSGADPHKMVLGVSPMGLKLGLESKENNRPLAPASLWSSRYPFLRSGGCHVDYIQMCFEINNNPNWTVVRDEYWHAPYAYNKDTWVSYDDELSVGLKMDLVLANHLGGAMIDHFHIDADPAGLCDRKYPLSSVILAKLKATSTSTPATAASTTSASPKASATG